MINNVLLVSLGFSFIPVSYAMEKSNPIPISSKEEICQKQEKAFCAHIQNNNIEKFKKLLDYVDKNYYSTKILSIYECKSTLLTIAVMYNRYQNIGCVFIIGIEPISHINKLFERLINSII